MSDYHRLSNNPDGVETGSRAPEPTDPAAVDAKQSDAELLDTLRQENTRLKNILSSLPDGVLCLGRSGECLYANTSDVFRPVDPGTELQNLQWNEILHPEIASGIRSDLKRAFETGSNQTHRFDVAVAGKPSTIEVRILPSASGEAVVVTRDMTDQVRMEEVLEGRDAILSAVTFAAERFLRGDAASETIDQFLKQLGEATGVGRVYIFKNVVLEGNVPGTEFAYEWTRDGIGSVLNSDLMASDRRTPWHSKLWYDKLSAGEMVSGMITDFPAIERQILEGFGATSITIAPIYVGDNWWGFFGFSTSDSKRVWSTAEIRSLRTAAMVLGAALEQDASARSLMESEERWRQLVDAHPGPIIVCSEGVVAYLNRTAIEILGATREEDVLGRRVTELLPSDFLIDCKGAMGAGAVSAPPYHEGEHILTGLDGVARVVEYVSVPTSYEGKAAVQIVLQNVTERKLYERGLIEEKERAEEMNRMKTTFLANMSHEIRTPLTSIIGYASLLSNEVTGKGQEFAQHIRAGADRLMDTLISVLDYAQLEGGALRVIEEPNDLSNELNQIWLLYRSRYREKGVSFTVERVDPRLSRVLLDKRALGRVVINLVDNALKFTEPPGSVVIRAHGDEPSETLTIEVSDTGIGINPNFLPHIFSAFKQESDGLGRRYDGNGLGLTITRKLVDLMSGEIHVDSKVGEGTTFVVTLPWKQKDRQGKLI